MMSTQAAAFVIYIINELADRYARYPSHVYSVLDKTGCIEKYLVPFYDVLHTMSSDSVAGDVIEYIRQRGESI